jgi:hypothetical protein
LYAEPSPDYFQYVDLGGGGLTPVGYGYRSIAHIVNTVVRLEQECDSALSRRQALEAIDQAGIIATPANSSYNERVIEAGRWSILNGAREARIEYNRS